MSFSVLLNQEEEIWAIFCCWQSEISRTLFLLYEGPATSKWHLFSSTWIFKEIRSFGRDCRLGSHILSFIFMQDNPDCLSILFLLKFVVLSVKSFSLVWVQPTNPTIRWFCSFLSEVGWNQGFKHEYEMKKGKEKEWYPIIPSRSHFVKCKGKTLVVVSKHWIFRPPPVECLRFEIRCEIYNLRWCCVLVSCST